jgi:DNA repair exonuclease SbcCD ATPase subunit
MIIERAKADELFGGRANSISDIESKQKTIDANKKFAEDYLDLIKESKERILKDKLNETISFEAKEAGREFSVPKFASDIEKINDYSRNIKSSEENIKNLETSIRTLENKKLGVFESKSKHEQKITEEKEKLAQEKGSKQNNENNRKYVLELQSDDLARIFDSRRRGQNDRDLFKEAGLEKTMTLGDALDKIQVYLDKLLNAKLDDKEIELLNKYTEAKSKFEKVNQSILELQKK